MPTDPLSTALELQFSQTMARARQLALAPALNEANQQKTGLSMKKQPLPSVPPVLKGVARKQPLQSASDLSKQFSIAKERQRQRLTLTIDLDKFKKELNQSKIKLIVIT